MIKSRFHINGVLRCRVTIDFVIEGTFEAANFTVTFNQACKVKERDLRQDADTSTGKFCLFSSRLRNLISILKSPSPEADLVIE